MALLMGVVPSVSARQVLEAEQNSLLEEAFQLQPDSMSDESDEDDGALSRLVDKSTFADLEFLNAGEAPTSIDQLKAMEKHVSSLYQRVEPAVVNIQSGSGQGSGVVVTSDGYILTAAHVISIPNRSAMITFPDGTRARAQTLGLFRDLDAGLLKIYEMVPGEKNEEEGEQSEDENSEDADDSEEQEQPEEDRSEQDQDEGSDDESDSDAEESDAEQESETDEDQEDKADEKEEPKSKGRFEVQEDLPSFSYLEIGDSGQLKLGQWVIAVGHPGGLDSDRGIVLRVGRVNEIEAEEEDAYVRTDCTLVGGDSGGPLIGMDGSVIGIHSRIGLRLKQNFHVPSNEYVNHWSEMLEPVVHDREAFMSLSFRGQTNVIDSVSRRSRAAREGLQASDRIIRVGDKEVYDKLQFDVAISNLKPYQKIEFEVLRKGKKQVIEITVGEKRRSLMGIR